MGKDSIGGPLKGGRDNEGLDLSGIADTIRNNPKAMFGLGRKGIVLEVGKSQGQEASGGKEIKRTTLKNLFSKIAEKTRDKNTLKHVSYTDLLTIKKFSKEKLKSASDKIKQNEKTSDTETSGIFNKIGTYFKKKSLEAATKKDTEFSKRIISQMPKNEIALPTVSEENKRDQAEAIRSQVARVLFIQNSSQKALPAGFLGKEIVHLQDMLKNCSLSSLKSDPMNLETFDILENPEEAMLILKCLSAEQSPEHAQLKANFTVRVLTEGFNIAKQAQSSDEIPEKHQKFIRELKNFFRPINFALMRDTGNSRENHVFNYALGAFLKNEEKSATEKNSSLRVELQNTTSAWLDLFCEIACDFSTNPTTSEERINEVINRLYNAPESIIMEIRAQ